MAYSAEGMEISSESGGGPGASYPPPPHVQYRSPSGDDGPVDITPVDSPAPAGGAPVALIPRNGRGTAALVLGCLALVCTGVLFFLFPLGLLFGLLAVVLGRSGRDRASWGGATNGASATAGLTLGSIALVLGTALAGTTVWLVQNYDVGALRDCVADEATAVAAGYCVLDVFDAS